MMLQEGSLQFDFKEAKDAFVFDTEGKGHPSCHGLSHCMKAVDFIVEYEDHYMFVEVKDPPKASCYADEGTRDKLIGSLVTKYRDSLLYRWAEGKLDKPIRYYCLVELDNALVVNLLDKLKQRLPMLKTPSTWKKNVVEQCAVLNQATWNHIFKDIPITRIEELHHASPQ